MNRLSSLFCACVFYGTFFLKRAGWNFSAFFRRLEGASERVEISYRPAWLGSDLILAFVMSLFVVFMVVDPLIPYLSRALPLETLHLFGTMTKAGSSHWYIIPAAALLLSCLFIDWKALPVRSRLALDQLMWQIAAFLISIAGSGLSANILKRIIGRARPKLFDEFGPFHFDPFAFKSVYASFPSGHATTMGAVLVFALVYFSQWRWSLIVLAVIVALTRVIIGSHYMSDIMMGLVYGGAFSWLILVYFTRRGRGYFLANRGDVKIVPKKPFAKASLSTVFKDVMGQFYKSGQEDLQGSDIASKRASNEESPTQ